MHPFGQMKNSTYQSNSSELNVRHPIMDWKAVDLSHIDQGVKYKSKAELIQSEKV